MVSGSQNASMIGSHFFLNLHPSLNRLGGVEFRLGDGVEGVGGRKALPTGTTRK